MKLKEILLEILLLWTTSIILITILTFFFLNFRPIPKCQEDQVLIGTGNFSNSRWSQYQCGPAADNYIDPDYLDFLLCIKDNPTCSHNGAGPIPNPERTKPK